ncbi:MAG: hypothetical protein JW940_26920 [Polyangiaceae bacterium]|nr:hypothetical protein [Polyangiaceae bacterium]
MNTNAIRILLAVGVAAVACACSEQGVTGSRNTTGGSASLGDAGGLAGSTGSGGALPNGGSVHMGGTANSDAGTLAGATATGGNTAAAGNTATGSTPAEGGTTGSGGIAGSGGTTSAGGTTSSGGGPGRGGSGAAHTGGTQSGGFTGTDGGTTGVTGGGAAQSGNDAGGSATGGTSAGGAVTGGSGGATAGNAGAATVQLDKPKQTIEGFGISDTWAPAMTNSEADALFDPTKGLGLSILRIGMDSDGGPMNDDVWNDIEKAKARGVDRFIATLWSAPGSCKDRYTDGGGGHLLTSCYDSWATTVATFPDTVKQNANVDLYAMSVQNEPDFCGFDGEGPCSDDYSTMLYTAEEMVAFVKVVGPKLRALNPPVKVIAPEVSEWIHLWTNDSAHGSTNPLDGEYDYGHALAADTEAWAQIDILGTHQYDTQVAEPWPSDVPQTKPVWMTEMSGIKLWPEAGPSSDIDNGVAVAGWIHDAIVNGMASAWLWWWYKANSDDNEGLYLSDGTDTKRHYTLGNYSRFIRPGYARVEVAGSIPTNVLLSAYLGADGTLVVVAINRGSASATVPISISGGTAPASLVPWVTSSSDNLASKTAVTMSGGSFTAELGGMTVTTFVGKQ